MISNKNKQIILTAVLTETFKPKFEELSRRFKNDIMFQIGTRHPTFVKALDDPNIRPYLAVTHSTCVRFNIDRTFKATRPIYGAYGEYIEMIYLRSSQSLTYVEICLTDTIRPAIGEKDYYITDETLHADYKKLWDDYTEAHRTLSDLLNGYANLKQLLTDFPEYAKYAPEPATKAQLPAICVEDTRNALAKLGVPIS